MGAPQGAGALLEHRNSGWTLVAWGEDAPRSLAIQWNEGATGRRVEVRARGFKPRVDGDFSGGVYWPNPGALPPTGRQTPGAMASCSAD